MTDHWTLMAGVMLHILTVIVLVYAVVHFGVFARGQVPTRCEVDAMGRQTVERDGMRYTADVTMTYCNSREASPNTIEVPR